MSFGAPRAAQQLPAEVPRLVHVAIRGQLRAFLRAYDATVFDHVRRGGFVLGSRYQPRGRACGVPGTTRQDRVPAVARPGPAVPGRSTASRILTLPLAGDARAADRPAGPHALGSTQTGIRVGPPRLPPAGNLMAPPCAPGQESADTQHDAGHPVSDAVPRARRATQPGFRRTRRHGPPFPSMDRPTAASSRSCPTSR